MLIDPDEPLDPSVRGFVNQVSDAAKISDLFIIREIYLTVLLAI